MSRSLVVRWDIILAMISFGRSSKQVVFSIFSLGISSSTAKMSKGQMQGSKLEKCLLQILEIFFYQSLNKHISLFGEHNGNCHLVEFVIVVQLRVLVCSPVIVPLGKNSWFRSIWEVSSSSFVWPVCNKLCMLVVDNSKPRNPEISRIGQNKFATQNWMAMIRSLRNISS